MASNNFLNPITQQQKDAAESIVNAPDNAVLKGLNGKVAATIGTEDTSGARPTITLAGDMAAKRVEVGAATLRIGQQIATSDGGGELSFANSILGTTALAMFRRYNFVSGTEPAYQGSVLSPFLWTVFSPDTQGVTYTIPVGSQLTSNFTNQITALLQGERFRADQGKLRFDIYAERVDLSGFELVFNGDEDLMEDIDFGNILYKTYSSSALYAVGDEVLFLGDLYRCITEIDTPEVFNPAKWMSLEYSSGATYTTGDKARYLGDLYVCVTDIPVPEVFNPSKWLITKEAQASPTFPVTLLQDQRIQVVWRNVGNTPVTIRGNTTASNDGGFIPFFDTFFATKTTDSFLPVEDTTSDTEHALSSKEVDTRIGRDNFREDVTGVTFTTQEFLSNPVVLINKSFDLIGGDYEVILSGLAGCSSTSRSVAVDLEINSVSPFSLYYELEPKDSDNNESMYLRTIQTLSSGPHTFDVLFGRIGSGSNSARVADVQLTVRRIL